MYGLAGATNGRSVCTRNVNSAQSDGSVAETALADKNCNGKLIGVWTNILRAYFYTNFTPYNLHSFINGLKVFSIRKNTSDF